MVRAFLFKRYILLFVFLFVWSFSSNAQNDDFENYRKNILSGFNAYRDNIHKEYQSFRDKINADYAEFMRKTWVEYNAFKGISIPEDSVPPVPIQKAPDNTPAPIEDNEIDYEILTPVIPEEKPQPQPVSPIEVQPVVTPLYFTTEYCGTPIKVRLSEKEKFSLRSVNENDVADCWNYLCSDPYDALLSDCLNYRDNLHLCDWAYFCMLLTVTDEFCGEDTNEATLLAAWLLCQSGYKIRIGKYGNILEFLFACEHTIFQLPYYTIKNEKYYPIHRSEEKLFVFDQEFQNERPLSLMVGKNQKLAVKSTSERVLQSERYPELKVSVQTNENDLLFYQSYPTSLIEPDVMTRWYMYADAPLSNLAKSKLYPFFKKTLSNMPKYEAALRLLDWVQTAFVYEYDDKVWGGDRAFFPEETLYYPYCDCEDRSILYSRLVRDLLGLDVLLVYYPGHLATAVAFDEIIKGDYLVYNGRRYVVADPTYIGAPIGMTMPNMDNSKAKVILLDK